MTDAGESQLYGQLIPLHEGALLLPKAAVLEIQGMDSISMVPDGPPWLLGFGEWRGGRIPAVSLESLSGAGTPARTRRSRLAVINSLGTHLEEGCLMVLTQGYPQLTPLNASALQRRPDLPEDAGVALSRVRLANTEAIIPDLEAIEKKLGQALKAMGDAEAAATDWQPAEERDS